MVRQLYS